MAIETSEQNQSVLIGTSGYSYEDWRGYFYPDTIEKNKMLDFYIQHFRTVEINSTYYRIPDQKISKGIAAKTPADFEIIAKVHSETTHRRQENESAMLKLVDALLPLKAEDKLKGLLAQFPYSFRNNEKNRRYLAETVQYCKGIPLFVEFRHNSWNRKQIVPFLQSLNIGYVNVDEPQLEGLLPAQAIVTNDMGYIRFHGRNEKMWWDGKGSERYDYLYNTDELKGWVENIKQIIRKTFKTYIYFNNHPRGQAVNNAKQMEAILKHISEKDK